MGGGRRVGREGRGGCGGLLGCCLAVFSGLLGAWGRLRLFSVALAFAGLEVVGLGGHGVGRRGEWPAGQGPVAGAPPVFAWSLSREFASGWRACVRSSGVCGPWQCGRAVVERVVEVVVPHCLGLFEPGLRGFRCVSTTGGSLSPVECRVEGFPRGALAACEGGGLQELLPAPVGGLPDLLLGCGPGLP